MVVVVKVVVVLGRVVLETRTGRVDLVVLAVVLAVLRQMVV